MHAPCATMIARICLWACPDAAMRRACNGSANACKTWSHVAPPWHRLRPQKEVLMRPSQALETNREALRAIAARHRVQNVRVFGSALREDDTETSDLDLLVDPTPQTTLMDIAAIQVEAERALGVRVDV